MDADDHDQLCRFWHNWEALEKGKVPKSQDTLYRKFDGNVFPNVESMWTSSPANTRKRPLTQTQASSVKSLSQYDTAEEKNPETSSSDSPAQFLTCKQATADGNTLAPAAPVQSLRLCTAENTPLRFSMCGSLGGDSQLQQTHGSAVTASVDASLLSPRLPSQQPQRDSTQPNTSDDLNRDLEEYPPWLNSVAHRVIEGMRVLFIFCLS